MKRKKINENKPETKNNSKGSEEGSSEETETTRARPAGGMGVPTMESDVEHFNKSMNLLSEAYGAE